MARYSSLEANSLRDVRSRFFAGDKLPAGTLRNEIQTSWQRCLQMGIDPYEEREFDTVTAAKARLAQEKNHSLLMAAREEVEHLAKLIEPLGYVVLLSDADLILVETLSACRSLNPGLRPLARVGVNIAEGVVGSTAPSAAVLMGVPLTVEGAEHFLESNQVYQCAAAPISDPFGRTIGALDVSAIAPRIAPSLLNLVCYSARSIENALFGQLQDVHLLRFHTHANLLDTALEAIAAVRDDGSVVAVNQAGLALLEIDRESVPGSRIESCFDVRASVIPSDRLTKIRLRSGMPVFVRCERKSRPHHGSRSLPASTMAALSAVADDDRLSSRYRPGETIPLEGAKAELASRAYARGIPVLLTGETGTGKELLARSLHQTGHRASGQFVPINCSALPENLIEAELFGYVDGAFTGARRGGAAGKIELAHQGTLFLDEIGDMPVSLQCRLLRVLQDKSVNRLGSEKSSVVDFSLVCATHRNLREMVASGSFREDLYYRVNGFTMTLPALRERADVLPLAESILRAESGAANPPRFSAEVKKLFVGHPWPGNIRELRNIISVAVAMLGPEEEEITADMLPEYFFEEIDKVRQDFPPAPEDDGTLDAHACIKIRQIVEQNRGNLAASARALNISRTTLYRKLHAMGYFPSQI